MDSMLLKHNLRHWTLFLGVLQITVGCAIGLLPPHAVAWYRGLVMAHIEMTANGVLMVVFAFLVKELALGTRALWVWFITIQFGTWTNGTAGLVAAFVGSSAPMLPSLNEKFPPPYGTNNPVVTGLLIVCAITMMVSLVLTLVGLARKK